MTSPLDMSLADLAKMSRAESVSLCTYVGSTDMGNTDMPTPEPEPALAPTLPWSQPYLTLTHRHAAQGRVTEGLKLAWGAWQAWPRVECWQSLG